MKIFQDVPDYIKELIPYPPGKPIEELKREYGVEDVIKLASNENDYGPSAEAVNAFESCAARLFRYPDGSGYYLKQALAERFGVSRDNIVLGNGSNEIIDFLCRVFVRPGRSVISSFPSFLVYQKMVQIMGGENIVVPLKGRRHDLDAMAERIGPETRIVFLDNPNNPMGTVLQEDEFAAFLERIPDTVLVVLDEAYGEFVKEDVDSARGADFIKRDRRVVFMRTFSKAYGLAGLRVGYGIMDVELARLLERVRQPFNVNLPAQEAALAALEDQAHLEMTLVNTWKEMERLSSELSRLGCRVFESHTNFMLVDVGRPARQVYEAMLRKGVIIRAMDAYDLPECIRITIGTRQENDRFLEALQEVLHQA